MIGSVCDEEVVAKLSFMGCRRGDYVDLCEVWEKGGVNRIQIWMLALAFRVIGIPKKCHCSNNAFTI